MAGHVRSAGFVGFARPAGFAGLAGGLAGGGKRLALAVAMLGSVAALGALPGCNRDTLAPAPDVDLAKFEGKWHEIAHFARSTQNECTATTATYTRQDDGRYRFVHECTLTDGRYNGSTAMARVPDVKQPGKLEVDFGAHVGDYWIIEIPSDYRYAVVGHPSRDYLWILSRTPTMAPADLQTALTNARAKSFDTNRLEYTKEGPAPQGDPTPPVTYGCSVRGAVGGSGTGGTGGTGAGSLGLVALAGVALLGLRRARRS